VGAALAGIHAPPPPSTRHPLGLFEAESSAPGSMFLSSAPWAMFHHTARASLYEIESLDPGVESLVPGVESLVPGIESLVPSIEFLVTRIHPQ